MVKQGDKKPGMIQNSFNIHRKDPMGLVYLPVFLHTSKYPLVNMQCNCPMDPMGYATDLESHPAGFRSFAHLSERKVETRKATYILFLGHPK